MFISNVFFTTLLEEDWEQFSADNGMMLYKAVGKEAYMYAVDVMFKYDAELEAISEDYASDNQLFLDHFAAAWTKLSNIDRFDGPMGNVCNRSTR